ncbi:Probable acrEF/envCD operon repressor [Kluyvera intermedia]|nr:Probable acrEF/envCD operon repressor [Kluyvera intermedia]
MMSEPEIRRQIGFNYDYMRTVLQGCVRNKILPDDANIEIILIILHSAFSGIIKNWLMNPQQFDLYQQAPLLVDNLMTTLCTQQHRISQPMLVANP